MRAHEAGALHGNDAAPTWLPYPSDVNTLIDGLWSRTTRRTEAVRSTVFNTFRVPCSAGSMRSRCRSLTLSTNGEAV